MSSFIHSFSHPTNMSAYHMPLFYIQGIQQRAKDSTLKNVCDNNKVVSDSKELKQQDVMEIILLIRKEVSLNAITEDKPQDKTEPIILKLGRQNSQQGDRQVQSPRVSK